MIKKCVQKPFTVLVAVIIVLALGFVSLTRMTTDLLPDMTLPYMMVITTYPGASPEKVESDVTEPLEGSLGTVNGVSAVTSVSSENYSMVMLEFEDDTNMDSAMVKVNSALETVSSQLPESCSTPNIMELSMDMMATMYASISYDDYDIYELSDFTKDTVVPYFERQNGVASVSDLGLIEKTVEVRLDQKKIDKINERIVKRVNRELAKAEEELNSARDQLADSKKQLQSQKNSLSSQQSSTNAQLAQAALQLDQAQATKAAYQAELTSLQAQQSALQAEKQAYEDNNVTGNYDNINGLLSALKAQLSEAATQNGVIIPASIEDAIQNPKQLAAFLEWLNNSEFAEVLAGAGVGSDELDIQNLVNLYQTVNTRIHQIDTELANLNTKIAAAQAMTDAMDTQTAKLDDAYKSALEGSLAAASAFGSADAQLSEAQSAIAEAEAQLETSQQTFEESRKAALENANIDSLVNMETLSGLIYAQNFAMPAGYIDDKDDNQWLLKVGEVYEDVEDLKKMILANMEGTGDIKLSDVAKITVVDNAGEIYAKINGQDAVILSIFKSSTAGTSEVSKACNEAIESLTKDYPGVHVTVLTDQGQYISMFIDSIMSSMLLGAVLAVIVLILFLKDVKPTLVIAFSIPFSLLTALVAMFFTDISINIMSLAGLGLGIGMLVDNSIVVIENIYRLRNRGLSAPRAALQGARQVAGAIIASTLTTICVFLPMVYTTGYTRQLMLPFALTISFTLIASLAVALTVVPCISSVLLKRTKETKHSWFEHIQNFYGKVLAFFLKVKVIPLVAAVLLLAFSIYQVVHMGITMLPDMTSEQISVTVVMPDETEKEEAYERADQIMEAIQQVENVDTVGIMDNTSSLLVSSAAQDDFLNYSAFVVPSEGIKTSAQIKQICKDIESATADMDCEIAVSSSAMGDMSALTSQGLQIDVYGDDLETLLSISQDLEELLEQVEGCEEISNGQEDGDQEIRLVIDKDEAMRSGITVAQIYQELSARITTSKSSTTLTVDGVNVNVDIVDKTDTLTVENLLKTKLESTTMDATGQQVKKTHKLKEFAKVEKGLGIASINRENNTRRISVTAATAEGYNTTLISREVRGLLKDYKVPDGYVISIGGETESVEDMVTQMVQLLALGMLFIYLVMVAQFQSLLSPFIIIFTVPLAFTGGLLGLLISGHQLSMMSMMGFMVLMGTIVNNGIVFVDYANQLRLGGMKKRDALIATGKTRMRPILMTALTTILSMSAMIFSQDAGSSMSKDMAIVVTSGLIYATFMTLFIVPVMYDILYRRQPRLVDVGDDSIDDAPDDAAEFIAQLNK